VIIESLIGGLGDIIYSAPGTFESPYHREVCERDEKQNLIRHTQDNIVREYSYNDLSELIKEEKPRESYEYNYACNIIRIGKVHFNYDENNRLVEASSKDYKVTYTYDNLGRRTSKTVNGKPEFYSHFGINEIIVFDSTGQLKELRIPGLSSHKDILRPIAIETTDAIYAPIHDLQRNIVKLINIKTKQATLLALPDPFGNGLSKNAPTSWIFSGKYYDKELDLVYFGHRYYSPKLKQWLSPDPAHQSSDLYQYCFNNPLSYFDPDGRISEKAQEHYNNATDAIIEAIQHSMVAGLSVPIPPVALIEAYKATKCWIEAATEYNAGCHEEMRDQNETETRDMVIEKERSE